MEIKKIPSSEKKDSLSPKPINLETPENNELQNLDSIVETIETLETQIQDDTTSVEGEIEIAKIPDSIKQRIKEKLKKARKKALTLLQVSALLVGAGAIAERIVYKNTRYEVQTIEVDGKTEYRHEDAETTRCLNIITGKERLSYDEKILIVRSKLKGHINSKDSQEIATLTAEIEKLNDEEVINKYRNESRKTATFPYEKKADDVSPVDFLNNEEFLEHTITEPADYGFDQETYEAIWRLEQECGNPKLRFRTEPNKGDLAIKHNNYNSSSNQINMFYEDIGEDILIEELAHSKQFNEAPISSKLRGLRDLIKTGIRGTTSGKFDYENAYSELYGEENTIEHEAHSVISPELFEKYDDLRPNYEKIEDEKLTKINEERLKGENLLKAYKKELADGESEIYNSSQTEQIRAEFKKTYHLAKTDEEQTAAYLKFTDDLRADGLKTQERIKQFRIDLKKKFNLN